MDEYAKLILTLAAALAEPAPAPTPTDKAKREAEQTAAIGRERSYRRAGSARRHAGAVEAAKKLAMRNPTPGR